MKDNEPADLGFDAYMMPLHTSMHAATGALEAGVK